MVYLPTFSWFCGKLVTVNIQSSHGCYGLYHISSTKSPNKPEPLRLQFLFTEARRHCPRSLEPSSKWRSWSPPPHDDEMDVDRPQKSNLRYPKWPIWHIWKESPPFPRPIILGILQPLLFGDVFIWKLSSWSRGIWHLLPLPDDTRKSTRISISKLWYNAGTPNFQTTDRPLRNVVRIYLDALSGRSLSLNWKRRLFKVCQVITACGREASFRRELGYNLGLAKTHSGEKSSHGRGKSFQAKNTCKSSSGVNSSLRSIYVCRNIRSRFVSYSQVLFPVAMNLLDTVSCEAWKFSCLHCPVEWWVKYVIWGIKEKSSL